MFSRLSMLFRLVMLGLGIWNRFRLFLFFVSRSIMRRVRMKFPSFTCFLNILVNTFLRNLIVKLKGLKFTVGCQDHLMVILPSFEWWSWRYINPEPTWVFIDAGAHIGKYTVQLAKHVKLVIAVEPHPFNYEYLQLNIRQNLLANVIAVNMALSSFEGKAPLYIGEKAGHHSLKRNQGGGYITVDVTTLDALVAKLSLDRVDYIKIDVEGAEMDVLKGGTNVLCKFRPKLLIETQSLDELKNYLSKFNYKVKIVAKGSLGGSYAYCIPA